MFIKRRPGLPFFSLIIAFFLSGIAFAGQGGAAAKGVATGAIAGRIMIKGGGPLADGQVLFYDAAGGPPPSPGKYERTPDIIRDIDAGGGFIAELPAGKYYMRAIKRLSGDKVGPPKEGDYVYKGVDEKGNLKEYIIQPGRFLDIGTISEAAPYKTDAAGRVVTTGVEGVILDTNGDPVENVVVVAFANPSVNSKPVFISDISDKDGKYTLPLTAGTYYLRVRNSFTSGPPMPGQIVGYYGDGKPAPITLKEGEVRKGINFNVIKFPGRGPFSGAPQKQ